MNEYLNLTSIGTISSVLLTVLTAVYVILTNHILKANRDAIRHQTRPYVTATLTNGDDVLALLIVNIGTRPAVNVVVDVTPSLDTIAHRTDDGKLLFNYETSLRQAYMPPHLEISALIGFSQNYDSIERTQFQFDVSYTDDSKKIFNERYLVDMPAYANTPTMMRYSMEYHLNKIAKTLKDDKSGADRT